jgi:hypothetical protein
MPRFQRTSRVSRVVAFLLRLPLYLFLVVFRFAGRHRRGRVHRAGITTKLEELKQELNTALLMVIEKDGAIGGLSEQLQNECQTFALCSPFLHTCHNFLLCSSFRDQNRAGAVADGSGAGRGRPEPSPGRPARVRGRPLEDH